MATPSTSAEHSPVPFTPASTVATSSAVDHSTPAPTSTTGFQAPPYASFPPFYTLQPNLTTRARQLDLWAELITRYCAHHRIFRLSLASLPAELFSPPALRRSLRPADARTVLDHMSRSGVGSGTAEVEWLSSGGSAGRNSSNNGDAASSGGACWVWWRSAADWAARVLAWVEETGQKGAVLTLWELREGEAAARCEWRGMDEEMLRKVLAVLVKKGKAQIFAGQGGDGEGVKFF